MNLLPIAMSVSAKTISQDLVSVSPIGGFTNEMIHERNQEKRRRKIEVLMGNATWEDFGDLPHEDHIFKGMPLTYMDYTYTTQTYNPNTI